MRNLVPAYAMYHVSVGKEIRLPPQKIKCVTAPIVKATYDQKPEAYYCEANL